MSRSDLAPAYTCGTYHRRGTAGCTSHHIRADRLDELIKIYIRRVMESSASMIERLNQNLAAEQESVADVLALHRHHRAGALQHCHALAAGYLRRGAGRRQAASDFRTQCHHPPLVQPAR